MSDAVLQGVLSSLLLEGEDGGWMQLLVFVVVAVFYALGGIIKARKRKGGVEQEDESASEPAPPEPRTERLRTIGRFTQPRERTVRPRSVLETFVEEITRAAQLDMQAPRLQKPPLAARTPRIETEIPELPKKQTAGAIASTQGKPLAVEAKQEADADYLPLIVPDLADRDDLTRAILCYEILGKPVSLRDPAQRLP